jgi:hypothetical protein
MAEFTAGIPRNINNFCFHTLSLACALRKRTVDAEVVSEVKADLDIEKLTSDSRPPEAIPAEPAACVSDKRNLVDFSSSVSDQEEILMPAQAASYMQQIALKLKDWRESQEKASREVRSGSTTRSGKS